MCIYGSWIITFICRSLVSGKYPKMDEIFDDDRFIGHKWRKEWKDYKKIYEDSNMTLEDLKLTEIDNTGYILKTLGCGFYAYHQIIKREASDDSKESSSNFYKRIQLEIVNCGGDADTNAAVSGQILGSYIGYSGLPMDWLYYLKHKKWLDQKLIDLFKVMMI
jgi:ADP-ribosylglycohydrolase